MILAVVGDGFIAQAVASAAREQGHTVRVIRDLVVHQAHRPSVPFHRTIEEWLHNHASARALVAGALEGCNVVVNAAGQARPASRDVVALYDANAVLPGVLARLATDAGVPRLVHVSTAAVQGRRDPLDESPTVAPFSPYSRSKAAGEQVLRQHPRGQMELTIYRPTSVQGTGRLITQRLLRRAARGRFVMPGEGNAPIPVCLIENVAAGVLHTTATAECLPVVLQPWEGMTARLLLEAIGLKPVFLPVPPAVVRGAARLALAPNWPRVAAPTRRAEMLVLGQRQVATALERSGFRPPVGPEGYQRLRRVLDEAGEPIG